MKMVILVNDQIVKEDDLSVNYLLENFPELRTVTESLIYQEIRTFEKQDKVLCVGQREMGIVSPDDDVIDIVGSQDATTCHIIILRHVATGVTGVAHLDSEDSQQFLALENAVRSKASSFDVDCDFEISIFGGYDDERQMSARITNTLFTLMNRSEARFSLKVLCTGSLNTYHQNGVARPKVYGAGVDVTNGQVFTAQFSYHGPDMKIRSLWGEEGLHNIYDSSAGQIVLEPFRFCRFVRDPGAWLKKTDAELLRWLSTSPAVEPPDFCLNLRASLEILKTDPDSSKSWFRNGKSRRYSRNANSGDWMLEQNFQ